MELEVAKDRLMQQAAAMDEIIAERVAIEASHQGERMFKHLAPFYPESIRWMGHAAVTIARTGYELAVTAPTIISNRVKGNK